MRGLVVAIAIAASVSCRPAAADPPVAMKRLLDVVLARDSEVHKAIVPERTTLTALFETHELLAHETAAIIASMREVLARARRGSTPSSCR